jgi:hypothetical protein
MKTILIAVILGALSAGCVVYGPPRHTDVVVGVAPYPGAVWVSGFWVWDGWHRHWQPGYWHR